MSRQGETKPRYIVWVSLVVAVITMTSMGAFAAGNQQRLSWQEFVKDPKRVASLRKGVAVMKSRNTAPHNSKEYRTSWEYWGAIHGYFGPQAKASTKAQYIARLKQQGLWQPGDEKFFEGLSDLTPPDATAKKVWDKCQHGTPDFFSWHRMSLVYFERVLRAAAGDNTLRLPYWDYSDPSQVAFPAEFSQPTYKNEQGQDVPNPLYDPRRAAQQFSLDPDSTNIDQALKQTTFTTFQPPIEGDVHGYVHCTVNRCPIALMGAVPVSANDPIFWLHHANIDRVWACWNTAGHPNPGGSWMTKSFSFVDENGSLVTHQVQALFGSNSIVDYTYDHTTGCSRTAPVLVAHAGSSPTMMAAGRETAMAAKPEAQPEVLGAVKGGVKITSAVVKAPIELPKSGPQAAKLKTMLAAPEAAPAAVPQMAELVLDGITYKAPPGSMFNIYLEKKSDPTQRRRVGTLNFFNAPLTPSTAAHHAQVSQRVYDVTDELRTLVGPRLDTEDVNVVFEATTGQAGSTPEMAASSFAPNISQFRVGKIELRLKPASR